MKKTAIILAAGMGKRLKHITQEIPKPLLSVANKTLIEYMIDFVHSIGCERVIVVAGYMYEKVEHVVRNYDSSVEIVCNNRFDLQNLLSFKTGLDAVVNEEDVFVCNADYIFFQSTVDAVKNEMNILSVYGSYDLSGNADDVMKIQHDHKNNVIQMSKQLQDFQSVYTGMFFLPKDIIHVVKQITNEILTTEDQSKTTVEYLFPALINKGNDIHVVDCGKANWFEIDTEEEWSLAKKSLEIL